MAEKYDAIVVGAGLGGVVCSALLAKKGLKVLMVDKSRNGWMSCRGSWEVVGM